MDESIRIRVTATVADVAAGRENPQAAAERLFPIVYDELRGLARGYMVRERGGHTLQPTALVNEAYMKMVDQRKVEWRGRSHFFAVCANAMRRILVDHARGRGRNKRAGGWQQVTLADVSLGGELSADELLALDEALGELARLDPRQARVVELRFFAGLKVSEIAEAVGVSQRSVEGDWTHARAWLRNRLKRGT